MNWAQQVWHVFRRDMARTWLALALFVLLMLVAVARAVEWPPAMRSGSAWASFLALLCAAVVVGGASLAGTVTKGEAVQAIPPIRASAAVASKMAMLLVLLLVYLAATLVTLSAWGLPPRAFDAVPMVTCVVMIMILLAVSVIASTARNAKSAVLAVVSVVAASVLAVLFMQVDPVHVAVRTWWLLAGLLAAGAGVVLWLRYQGRSHTVPARVATMACGWAVLALPLFTEPATRVEQALSTDLVTLSMPVAGELKCLNGVVVVPVKATAPSGWRVNLQGPTLTVVLLDGSTFETRSLDWSLNARTGVLIADGSPPARVVQPAQRGEIDVAGRTVSMNFPMSPEQETRACGRIARLRMTTGVTVATAEALLRLPATTGVQADSAGVRVRVVRANPSDADIDITVDVSLIVGDPYSPRAHEGGLSFSLIDHGSGDTLRLASSYTGSDSFRSGFSALPGLRNVAYTVMLARDSLDSVPPKKPAASRVPQELLVSGQLRGGFGMKRFETVVSP